MWESKQPKSEYTHKNLVAADVSTISRDKLSSTFIRFKVDVIVGRRLRAICQTHVEAYHGFTYIKLAVIWFELALSMLAGPFFTLKPRSTTRQYHNGYNECVSLKIMITDKRATEPTTGTLSV